MNITPRPKGFLQRLQKFIYIAFIGYLIVHPILLRKVDEIRNKLSP